MLRVRRSIPTGCRGAIRSLDGCPLDRIALAFLRPRLDPGEAVFGDRELGHRALQHARQGRLAPEAAVRLGEGPERRRARRDGQGLRVRERPLRHLLARGAEGAAGEPEPHHRHRRLHPRQGGRSDLLRQGLLPRPRQARRQALQPADGGDARERPLRPRQVGLEGQAVRGAGAPGRRRPGAAAAALRRRGALAEGAGHREGHGLRRRAQAGDAADRPDLRGHLRPDDVRGRGEEAHPRRDRREDRRQADRGDGAGRAAAGRPGDRPDGSAARQPGHARRRPRARPRPRPRPSRRRPRRPRNARASSARPRSPKRPPPRPPGPGRRSDARARSRAPTRSAASRRCWASRAASSPA